VEFFGTGQYFGLAYCDIIWPVWNVLFSSNPYFCRILSSSFVRAPALPLEPMPKTGEKVTLSVEGNVLLVFLLHIPGMG